MKKCLLSIIILLCSILVYPQMTKPDQLIRKKAVERVKKELESQLSARLGTEVDVDSYLLAINHLTHGELDQAKSLITQKALQELLKLVVGGNYSNLIINAWKFDVWVWQSVHQWADDHYREKFRDEFLRPHLLKWYQEGRFGFNKPVQKGFTENVTRQFNAWCDKHYEGIVAIKLYANKKKRFQQFKEEMWAALLQGVNEVAIHVRLKETSRRLKSILNKKIQQYEKEMMGQFDTSNMPAAQVLELIKKLLPRYMLTFKYPGKKIKMVLNGAHSHGDVYTFFYYFYTGAYSRAKARKKQYQAWGKNLSITDLRKLVPFIQNKFMQLNTKQK